MTTSRDELQKKWNFHLTNLINFSSAYVCATDALKNIPASVKKEHERYKRNDLFRKILYHYEEVQLLLPHVDLNEQIKLFPQQWFILIELNDRLLTAYNHLLKERFEQHIYVSHYNASWKKINSLIQQMQSWAKGINFPEKNELAEIKKNLTEYQSKFKRTTLILLKESKTQPATDQSSTLSCQQKLSSNHDRGPHDTNFRSEDRGNTQLLTQPSLEVKAKVSERKTISTPSKPASPREMKTLKSIHIIKHPPESLRTSLLEPSKTKAIKKPEGCCARLFKCFQYIFKQKSNNHDELAYRRLE